MTRCLRPLWVPSWARGLSVVAWVGVWVHCPLSGLTDQEERKTLSQQEAAWLILYFYKRVLFPVEGTTQISMSTGVQAQKVEVCPLRWRMWHGVMEALLPYPLRGHIGSPATHDL